MTAEIAVMNRRAIAFAADSAMTISATGKTYNSADKIFELSTKNPIGLMLYNTLDYMGMPLDVLIKNYRDSAYCCNFQKTEDAPERFFEYIYREFTVLGEDEDAHVDSLVAAAFGAIQRRFLEMLIKTRPSGSYQTVFQSLIYHSIKILEGYATSECFYDYTIDDFISRYDSIFDAVADEVFEMFPLDATDKELLKRLAALSLQKAYFSPLHTGFVFSGYGESELFPTLQSFQFDGMIMGRLKCIRRNFITIDTNNTRAKIVPFAQHEMVDRFLVGIDERHERTIVDNIRRNLDDLSKNVLRSLPGIRRATKQRLRQNLSSAVDTVLSDLRERTIQELKDESAAESEDAVMFMAKPDLANFAEALVNITSVKRRASLETESVGGPIDVAVISKDDGFVWVKRKHYFNPDLNPRFFARKYGNVGQRNGGAA